MILLQSQDNRTSPLAQLRHGIYPSPFGDADAESRVRRVRHKKSGAVFQLRPRLAAFSEEWGMGAPLNNF